MVDALPPCLLRSGSQLSFVESVGHACSHVLASPILLWPFRCFNSQSQFNCFTAGNEDMAACDTSPAREASAVTVGATDEQDRRLWLAKGAWVTGG